MKAIFPTIAVAALILLPPIWTTADAQGTSGEPAMQDMPGMASMKPEASDWGHPGKASAVDRVIHIRAEDSMRFVPAKLTVKAGSTVKFVITNTGKLEHELVLGPPAEQQEHEQEMQAMMHSGSDMHMSGMSMMNDKSSPDASGTHTSGARMGGMPTMGGIHMSGEDRHAEPNEVELAPGATRTLIWTFTKPGTYQYGCHESGHYVAGMVGTVTVVKEQ